MNKPIRLNAPINDINSLLNKFILYKHTSLPHFVLVYVYRVGKQILSCCRIYKINGNNSNFCFDILSLRGINDDLFKKNWNIYVF